ncbi:MAG: molybdate ABC transporter substrate-binding protein [Kineosporiaceae bacterium]
MRRPAPAVLAGLALASTLLAGCGSTSSVGAPSASSGATQASVTAVSGALTVFAAASLTDAFETLGSQFQKAHPGTTVTFNVGASSALATQITQGAPADVFASASTKTMDTVVAARAASSPRPFAQNVMQIAVPPGNPAHIASLADLAAPGVKVALCQAAAPCGATAARVLANAGLTVTPVTEEADVKSTLAKVQLGEVDAGLVYVTDVLAARGKVTGIEIPARVNASTSYPIAALTASKNPSLATAFVDYVLSADGVRVLTAAGFRQP